MSKPTLSVVIPNYNHAHYIGKQLEAIIDQTFSPIEIIVVDDASTDNSVEVINQFVHQDSRIRLVCNEQNKGVNQSSNHGISLASGDYIYSCSADDMVLPGLFEKSMNLLMEYPNAELCCSHPAFFDDETGMIDKHEDWFRPSAHSCYFSPEVLIPILGPNVLWIAGHTCIVKRETFFKAGQYLSELEWYSDWFIFHVIAFRTGICYVPEALAALRVLPSSYSALGSNNSYQEKAVVKQLISLLKSEQYRDVLPAFRDSKVLDTFSFAPVLRKLLSDVRRV